MDVIVLWFRDNSDYLRINDKNIYMILENDEELTKETILEYLSGFLDNKKIIHCFMRVKKDHNHDTNNNKDTEYIIEIKAKKI